MKKSPLLHPLAVFTGGGTGGHVFPGLAVWDELQTRWPGDFLWVGAKGGMEEALLKERNLPFRGIPAGKLRRYLSIKNLTDIFKILTGFLESLLLFIRRRPAFVFSKGGFVSVPPVWAAGILGIPVYSHESDLNCGLATRLNLRYSRKVFVAYSETLAKLPKETQGHGLVSGNPVRLDITRGRPESANQRWGIPPQKKVVLVLGGSQGAKQINDLIPGLYNALKDKVFFIHQTGKNWERVEGPGYVQEPFFGPEIADALARADLLISRAGAGSLWEAAYWKVPMVLIPLEVGSRGDQVLNAYHWENLGCATVLRDPSPPELEKSVLNIIDHPEILFAFKNSFSLLPKVSAAKFISETILAGYKDV